MEDNSILEDPNDSSVGARKRTTNFTPNEKLALIEIISKKHKHILENKKTDKVSLGEKNIAWNHIEIEFNAASPSGVFRNHDTLKRLYDNRKREIKRILPREKQLRLKTGGGPEPKPSEVLDTADQILLTMINEKTVRGLENPVDCDNGPNIIRLISVQKNVLIFDGNFDTYESSGSDALDSTNHTFKNYTNETVLMPKLQESFTAKLPATQSTSTGSKQPCWKKATDLKRKTNPALQCDNKDTYESSGSDALDSTNHTFKNYTNETVLMPKLQESFTAKLPATQSTSTGSKQPCWKKASDLKRKTNPALQCDNKVPKTVGNKRNAQLSAQKSIKILASTDIAKKYNTLLDSRQILLEKQIELGNQELTFARTKNKLEIEILELELAKKKREL